MKQYKPKPIDTKDIVLPTELNNLIEEMSKNVHEVWMLPPIPVIYLLANNTDKCNSEKSRYDGCTCCEQPPYTLGKLAVSLVPEQSKEPSQCLAQASPQYREEHFC